MAEEDIEKQESDATRAIDANGRPEISVDDKLNLFRHLTGIISRKYFVLPFSPIA